MRKLFFVALAALIGMPVMSALAGECDKVRSSYSRAVCNTPELAQLNQRVETAYEALRQKLYPKNQIELAAGQRQWRQYARLACAENGIVVEEPYNSDGLGCLVGLIGDRADFLESDWVVDGVPTFPLETYAAKPDALSDFGPPVGSFTFIATLIGGRSEEAEAFNAYVRAGYTDGGLLPENDLSEFDGSFEFDLRTSIYEITSRRISSVTNYYFYGHGAAHGNSSVTYEHFLVKERRQLEGSDIFSGADWKRKLIDLIKNRLRNEPELSEAIWEELDTVDIVAADPTRWRFLPTGIEIQFQPYEITPYVYGLPAIELKWSELEGMLAPDALAIAGAD